MERGYCHMIGGEPANCPASRSDFPEPCSRNSRRAAHVGATGKPSQAEYGYLHCGPNGAGHFVKMVHNGIEYGIMAAYSEGLNILKNANVGHMASRVDAETAPLRNPELYRFDFDIAEIAEVWRRGSVIGSWLLDLTASALRKDPDLAAFEGHVADSGEGRWTLQAAIDEGVPVPVLSAALFERFELRGLAEYADRLLSAMRFEFGGHVETPGREGHLNEIVRFPMRLFSLEPRGSAKKQIFPALEGLVCDEGIDTPIIGVAREGWSLDQLKARAWESISSHGGRDDKAFAKLSSLLRFVAGDYTDPSTYTRLRQALGEAKRPLHYLAIPPSLFATVAEGLAKQSDGTHPRLVIEKPFGHSRESRANSTVFSIAFFRKNASSGLITTLARSRYRTYFIRDLRIRCSNRSGTAPISTAFRSLWLKISGWWIAADSMMRRAPFATFFKTTCCKCWPI